MMNTIPESIDNMRNDMRSCISGPIESQKALLCEETKRFDVISELLENWKLENIKMIQGVDDKVTEVLKTVNEKREERVKVKTKKKAFERDFYSERLRRSNRIRRKAENSSSDDDSGSNSDDEKGNRGDADDDGYWSYNLILPSTKENEFTADDIKLAVSEAKNGVDLERKFKKLKLKFTKFDEPKGNILEPIFEVLHKTGCVPQPRGLVCVRCGHNIYGGEIDDMIGIMRLHYKNKHSQWCKRIDFDQFIRCYRNFCTGKFETEEETIQLDMSRIGIEWCKNLKCQFVCSKYTTLVEHMMMEHNKRWNYEDVMNPF
jgi:hypothetical protein